LLKLIRPPEPNQPLENANSLTPAIFIENARTCREQGPAKRDGRGHNVKGLVWQACSSTRRTLAAISAGEMLTLAVKSLGLMGNATAEEITLAASKRLYQPPAVQRLLHAARLREGEIDVH